MHHTRPRTRQLTLAALTLAACTGSVVSPGFGGPGDDGLGAAVDRPPVTPGERDDDASPTAQFAPAPSALRLLTVRQYHNTVRDLFGADVTLPADLVPDTAINGFFAIGAAKATVSPAAAEKFESAAFALAEQALEPARRDAFVGCTPSGVTDERCTTDFVRSFGRRAFRRPLRPDELARYVGLAAEAQAALGDFHQGLAFAVAGLLQSPSFLFRVELGAEPAPGSSMRPYDDYELATRLSYLLWNTTPDEALLSAAERGELSTLAGLDAQAERLLADPRARPALADFHSERLALEELDTLDKHASVYAGGVDDALRRTMRDDVLDTIEEYTFGARTDFRELFTTRVAFVDAKLAALYGLPAVGAHTRVELPAEGERLGLLGKAAFLATQAHLDGTSPTKRGKFIRERMLCQSIPAPPPEVSTVLPEPDPSAPTMRARLAAHTAIPSCAGCHQLMDPLGLSLEKFDTLGRFRETDDGHTLDVTGTLDGTEYDGARRLGELLRDDEDASACVARQVYRYATAHVETRGEEPALEQVIAAFADSGYQFRALVRAVVASDGFRFGAKE